MQQHVSLTKSVDADELDASELVDLFEPNEEVEQHGGMSENGRLRLCSYDRVAQPRGAYYLVAQRGVGKTHILRLLFTQLEEHHHIALEIQLATSEIISNYRNIKEVFSGQGPLVWELTILEEVAIRLCKDKHLAPLPSRVLNRLLPKLVRRRVDLNRALLDYLRTHRPEDWRKLRDPLAKTGAYIAEKAKAIGRALPKRIRFGVLSIEGIGNASSGETQTSGFSDEIAEVGTADERVMAIEEWVWAILQDMQNDHSLHKHEPLQSFFTRSLPEARCVYVIADQLDQTKEPLDHDTLYDLFEATRNLNRRALHRLGKTPNFKVVLAMRAVTYRDFIEPQVRDLEQLRPHVEILTWSRAALGNLMARRVLDGGQLPSDRTADEILSGCFPTSVHYFGREFKSSIEFVFEHAGMRPRQILLFWQKCAEQAGGKDYPYSTQMTEEDMVRGMEIYAQEILPGDIAREYELDYPGLQSLLEFFALRREEFEQVIARSVLEETIVQVQEKYKEKENMWTWLFDSPSEVLEILFRVGVIGIPTTGTVNPDWPAATYVHDQPYFTTRGCDEFCVRPSFWLFMTNIRRHFEERRQFALSLYEGLRTAADQLDAQFDELSEAKDLEFEYRLGRFLALGRRILDLNNYSEPVDWVVWSSISNAIVRSWDYLAEVIWKGSVRRSGRQGVHTAMEEIATFFAPPGANSGSSAGHHNLETVNWEQFQIIVGNANYKRASAPVRQWLEDQKREPVDSQKIVRFRNSLLVGDDSLWAALGEGIDRLKGFHPRRCLG